MTANPSKAESIVIKYRAESAPIKTTNLLFVMARIAAIKKVLSPISETRMTVIDEAEKYIFESKCRPHRFAKIITHKIRKIFQDFIP